MIIFGTRGTTVSERKYEQAKCTNCSESGLLIGTLIRYFHIYWIPMFPLSRRLYSVCPHCKQSLDGTEIRQDDRFSAVGQLRPASFPLRFFAGLAAAITFVGYAIYDDAQQTARLRQLAAAPAINDIYVVSMKASQGKTAYGVMKLVAFDDQKANFLVAGPRYNASHHAVKDALIQASGPKYFAQEVEIGRDEIARRIGAGQVSEIIRDAVSSPEKQALPPNSFKAGLGADIR